MRTATGMGGKFDKVPGAGEGTCAVWIPKNKVPAFKKLFDLIREKCGGYDKARDYIGLAASSLDGLEKGKITVASGRMILSAYKNICR